MNNLVVPQKVFHGSGAISKMSTELHSSISKVAVFTDNTILNLGLLNTIFEQIKQSDSQIVLINNIHPEPTSSQAEEIVKEFVNSDCDIIVAVGGGSVIDIAKLASLFSKKVSYSIKDLINAPQKAKNQFKTIIIPTTAGTGAEATPNSILKIVESNLKVGIISNEMVPDVVILDAEITAKLPEPIVAATGVDALCHAVECYTSLKATPFSNMFSLEAIKLILGNLKRACTTDAPLEARSNMLLAAFYAGVAISCSGTTAVHALSYPLGGKYNVPHGVANSILLLPVMRFNKCKCVNEFALIVDTISPNNKLANNEEKANFFMHQLEELIACLPIPKTLEKYGISKNDVESLVEAGMSVERLLSNNKRTLKKEDAAQIYMQIIEQE